MRSAKINWGIIGTGKIAHKFAEDLKLANNSVLYAVSSRNSARALDFAHQIGALKHFGTYESMVADPDVDVVYVATPHAFHFEHTMMCLKNGKAVLCEKPMGVNTAQVAEMLREAKKRRLFLMEGIWTRFIPATEKLIELLNNKTIGELQFIRADFGFKSVFNPVSRLFNPDLGGGSLLDIGIYPVYLSLLALGTPLSVKAVASYASTGVDSACMMLFDYSNGARAMLESSFEADTPVEAYLHGSDGEIKMHSRFHHTRKLTINVNNKVSDLEIDYRGNGYIYEIEEVEYCLLNGLTQSTHLPLTVSADLIAVIERVMKEISHQCGDAGSSK